MIKLGSIAEESEEGGEGALWSRGRGGTGRWSGTGQMSRRGLGAAGSRRYGSRWSGREHRAGRLVDFCCGGEEV